MKRYPRRGDIWWVSLDPTKGSEIKKTRPCLVLSRDAYNRHAGTVTIVPLTSGLVKYPAWEVDISGTALSATSHAVLPQLRVASKKRFKKYIGGLTSAHLSEVAEKLYFYLGLDLDFGS